MLRPLTLALLMLSAASLIPAGAQGLTGAGSTLAYPVIAGWIAAYHAATGRDVVYQPVGSTAGETSIRQGLVDFGVTDAPLVDAQLLRDGLSQFPLVMGAIVPAVNLDGIAPGRLRLPAGVLADIYLGRVTRWRDPDIAAANPGLALPDRAITVLYRADGSGTSFNWTHYLSRASLPWRARAGTGTKVAWPTGSGVQGTGGMTAAVARIKGAIGYVEYSAAERAGLAYALAENSAGRFVRPGADGYEAAVGVMDWSKVPDFAFVLSDTTDPGAYPLMATSFVLVRGPVANPVVTEFLRWVLDNGGEQAARLGFLPLPAPLIRQVEAHWPAGGQFPVAGAPAAGAQAADSTVRPAPAVVRAAATVGP